MILMSTHFLFTFSFEVLLEGKSLSHVSQYEFLNSPEWLSMSEDVATTYQVATVELIFLLCF